MGFLALVPLWIWKWVGIALAVLAVALLIYGQVKSYGNGRYKAGYEAMEAKHLEYKLEVTTAAAAASEKAREIEHDRHDKVDKANVVNDRQVRAAADTASAYRRGLRDAASAAGRSRVPERPVAADGCPICARCPTKAELLGIGEALIGVAENADREHAGLMACAAAWPKEGNK